MGIFDDDDEDFVPFNERFDWDDVTPIEQDEGPNPVCVITYSDECLSLLPALPFYSIPFLLLLLLLLCFLIPLCLQSSMS